MPFQTGISFQNFKSFKDKATFDFTPFTILTGGNSSGKSTIFQALSFFNTFIAETIKKNINNYDKNEKDSLLSTLFLEVDSNKFINQNKIFTNLLNRESNSSSLNFEIPLALESYSNKVIAKLEFELKLKISHTCQLKKIIIYDDVLNKSLVECRFDGGEVKMNVNFNLFYKDIILRAEKLNLLIECIKKISLEQGVETISERMGEIVQNVNNNENFKNLSYSLFGHVVNLSTMVHYTQKIIVKDHPGRFDSASDLFIEFDKNNIYLFVFQTSMFAMNNKFDNYKKYISKSINILDGFISLDSFDILNDEFYIENDRNIIDNQILKKISDYEFVYDLKNPSFSSSNLSWIINCYIHDDILKLNYDDEFYHSGECLSNFFIEFINDFIFNQIVKSLIGFDINVIELGKDIPLDRYFDLRDSKYDFITDYFKKNEHSGLIDSWLQNFKIGNKLNFNILNNSFISVLIDNNRNIADEGQGIKNLIYTMFKLYSLIEKSGHFYKGKLVYIEEPENGLHPAYHSIFAKLLFSICKQYKLQFIIETHSEYFIRQLQVLVATNVAQPTDVNVYYFNNNINQTIADKCYEITIDEYGTLSRNFGSGFFDESSNLNVILYTINRDNYN